MRDKGHGLPGLFQHNQPVVITPAGFCHASRLGYGPFDQLLEKADPVAYVSVFPWSPGGRSCNFWDFNPQSQLPREWCDGYHAESYSTEEMKQQVKGDELMTAISIKQGLKSKFGSRAKQYGAVYYNLYS